MKGGRRSIALKSDLQGLRTGRANTRLAPIRWWSRFMVSMMPLNQVATVSAPEPRMLSVQVWDKSNLTAGGNGHCPCQPWPQPESSTVRRCACRSPDLTQERRNGTRQARRAICRKGQDRDPQRCAAMRWKASRPTRKRRKFSEDERKRFGGRRSQKLTDPYVKDTDEAAAKKEQEILTQ